MTSNVALALFAALAGLNLVTWAFYRWDKRQARRGAWRVSERTLLVIAWFGGWVGALAAVYGHRERHKARKPSFMVPLWMAAIAWVVGLAVIVQRFSSR